MISEGFVTNGAKVYVSSRDGAACEKAAAELTALGTEHVCLVVTLARRRRSGRPSSPLLPSPSLTLRAGGGSTVPPLGFTVWVMGCLPVPIQPSRDLSSQINHMPAYLIEPEHISPHGFSYISSPC